MYFSILISSFGKRPNIPYSLQERVNLVAIYSLTLIEKRDPSFLELLGAIQSRPEYAIDALLQMVFRSKSKPK